MYLKYLSDLLESLRMMVNKAKDDTPVQLCISNPW